MRTFLTELEGHRESPLGRNRKEKKNHSCLQEKLYYSVFNIDLYVEIQAQDSNLHVKVTQYGS